MSTPISTRRTITVDHLARVEGHGGITVELEDDRVGSIRFDVFEGIRLIEGLIGGRSWEDVSPIVSRICAICSVAHALTSIRATETAFGVDTSLQTELLRELMWRGESIESHALHLFLLAAPDYLGYPSAPAMAEDHPGTVAVGLRLKQLGNLLQGGVGGRAIHPVNAIPGGFGKVPDEASLIVMRQRLVAARPDVDAAMDFVRGLPAPPALDVDTTFVALRQDEDYRYDRGDDVVVLEPAGRRWSLAADAFLEVAQERSVPHSHAKHVTLEGRPFMVGALARLAINRDRLPGWANGLVEAIGLRLPSRDPLDNNRAQAVELALDVHRATLLVERLLELGPVTGTVPTVSPRAATATAITEAPRGTLVHSYTYDAAGRIVRANVITPTVFNAASMERHFQAAAARDGVEDEPALKRTLEMISRAYDPCISCAVHLTRRQRRDPGGPAAGR
ncbi:MAG: Ni/Fe hydrogenase subunit alpha [Gemmatimonadetes bacterium]|nr:Ni/Fe hydrogenase subunit alpha [Gemmatimonadota bacterium]NIQ57096.1 Ni/Fe hydrogenase subunit alpha [Gemmatimonadota bacterium]NIU77263.1 Ni/Fe hydrogenase subunit alpha [Gammaproteobacteria bacterium]NIX46537.1 Ni/Fe hydrogenase subunit alpha [Gemmatimonadota bacterium]NIY10855.1 Ni/Fe hydrogenase subunit alpha [Gemmatimonadota bacterium]